ncbi:MAG: magnesium/cobalt transporter CorA [Candidatus Natronoplasma sp.]
MKRMTRSSSDKVDLPSDSFFHMSESSGEDGDISIIDYDKDDFEERESVDVEECEDYKERSTVTWINVDGLQDAEKIKKLTDSYGFHPLLVEDILNTQQRPKFEEFEDHLFLIMKMTYTEDDSDDIVMEQVSLVIGENFLLSFQEKSGDVFESIRERIRKGKGRIRNNGADYLAYALIDAVVDHYFVVLEKIGDRIEDIEGELVKEPDTEVLYRIHNLKREMIGLRRSVWPLREVINSLLRGDSHLVMDSTEIYFRDVYDHTIQVADTIETNRDILSGLLDLYLSSISNKMNEVMKVLTIIATIFIPLTFIAGIYGMNFDPEASPFNMPELNWALGYPITLAGMLVVALLMVVYFRRKGWL